MSESKEENLRKGKLGKVRSEGEGGEKVSEM